MAKKKREINLSGNIGKKNFKLKAQFSGKSQSSKSNKNESDKTLFAFLATFLSIIGFFIAIIVKRNDKYVMYYAKQSLVIFIIGVLAGVIGIIMKFIPIIGHITNFALWIIIIIVWILSWIYSLSGKEEHIPIISDWAKKIDL